MLFITARIAILDGTGKNETVALVYGMPETRTMSEQLGSHADPSRRQLELSDCWPRQIRQKSALDSREAISAYRAILRLT
jgi:hypothetical protein